MLSSSKMSRKLKQGAAVVFMWTPAEAMKMAQEKGANNATNTTTTLAPNNENCSDCHMWYGIATVTLVVGFAIGYGVKAIRENYRRGGNLAQNNGAFLVHQQYNQYGGVDDGGQLQYNMPRNGFIAGGG